MLCVVGWLWVGFSDMKKIYIFGFRIIMSSTLLQFPNVKKKNPYDRELSWRNISEQILITFYFNSNQEQTDTDCFIPQQMQIVYVQNLVLNKTFKSTNLKRDTRRKQRGFKAIAKLCYLGTSGFLKRLRWRKKGEPNQSVMSALTFSAHIFHQQWGM